MVGGLLVGRLVACRLVHLPPVYSCDRVMTKFDLLSSLLGNLCCCAPVCSGGRWSLVMIDGGKGLMELRQNFNVLIGEIRLEKSG